MRNLKDTIEDRVHQVNPYIQFDIDEYRNINTPMDCYCTKHDFHFTTTLRTFTGKQSLGCYYCKTENKKYGGIHVPLEVVIKTVKAAGYIFIDVFYENKKCKVKFRCPKHWDKGIQIANFQDLRKSKNCCGFCNGTKRTTEDFQKILDDKFNGSIKVIGEYTLARNRVKCRCLIDGYEWEPLAYNLLSGFGCPQCGSRRGGLARRTSNEDCLVKLAQVNPDVEIISFGDTSHDYSECRCRVCGHVWMATYSNLTHKNMETSCPMCNISRNERRIADLLKRLRIHYVYQCVFDDCVDKKELPFDFYLPDYNTAIEYDGELHYIAKFGDENQTAQERLAYTQRHDQMKTDYCNSHNIKLIRIPYWESKNLEAYINIDNISA